MRTYKQLLGKIFSDEFLLDITDLQSTHPKLWAFLCDNGYVGACEFLHALYPHKNQLMDHSWWNKKLTLVVFLRIAWLLRTTLSVCGHYGTFSSINIVGNLITTITFSSWVLVIPICMFSGICFDYRTKALFDELKIDYTLLVWKLKKGAESSVKTQSKACTVAEFSIVWL